MLSLLIRAGAAIAAAAALPAFAHTVVYVGSFTGASENPPVETTGTGWARVTVDEDAMTMRVEASFSDLIGDVTAAHIHCCTAEANAGNVGVATQTPSFSGFPHGGTSGDYDVTFDMAQSTSYNPAFITANGGTVGAAFGVLITGLAEQKAYFNIHTTFSGSGEIRALLAPIPEPGTYALMGAGLVLLLSRSVRRPAAARR